MEYLVGDIEIVRDAAGIVIEAYLRSDVPDDVTPSERILRLFPLPIIEV